MTYEESLTLISEKWSQLTQEQKIDVIQAVEDHEAEINGRTACSIEGKFLYTGNDGIVLGQYDRETRSIYINDSQLSSDSKYGNSSDKLLQTVLHEGRHSYQHQVIEGTVEHEDKKEIEQWKENFDRYISFKEDPRGYYNQPIEIDARTYAVQRYQQMLEERVAQKDHATVHESKESGNMQIKNSILVQPVISTISSSNIVSQTNMNGGNESVESGIQTCQQDEISTAKDVFISQLSDDYENSISETESVDNTITFLDDGGLSTSEESDDEGISM